MSNFHVPFEVHSFVYAFKHFRVLRARLARFSQQNPHNCYSKLAQSRFEGGPVVNIKFQGVKYTFFRGLPLIRFTFQGLNITFLEANSGLDNTAACQLDASSEDCLDVFDLEQRCLDQSVCVIKVPREL